MSKLSADIVSTIIGIVARIDRATPEISSSERTRAVQALRSIPANAATPDRIRAAIAPVSSKLVARWGRLTEAERSALLQCIDTAEPAPPAGRTDKRPPTSAAAEAQAETDEVLDLIARTRLAGFGHSQQGEPSVTRSALSDADDAVIALIRASGIKGFGRGEESAPSG